jgi:hypothetical protein
MNIPGDGDGDSVFAAWLAGGGTLICIATCRARWAPGPLTDNSALTHVPDNRGRSCGGRCPYGLTRRRSARRRRDQVPLVDPQPSPQPHIGARGRRGMDRSLGQFKPGSRVFRQYGRVLRGRWCGRRRCDGTRADASDGSAAVAGAAREPAPTSPSISASTSRTRNGDRAAGAAARASRARPAAGGGGRVGGGHCDQRRSAEG